MKKAIRLLTTLAVCYWLLVVLIYAVAGEQFHYSPVTNDTYSPSGLVGELTDNIVIRQQLSIPADRVTGIEIRTATFARENTGTLMITLSNAAGQELACQQIPAAQVPDGEYLSVQLDEPVLITPDEPLTLTLSTTGAASGNAVSVYFGNTILAGRVELSRPLSAEEFYTINDAAGAGKLCARLNGLNNLTFYRDYWLIAAGLFAVAAAYAVYGLHRAKQGKTSGMMSLCLLCTKYQFLLRQLVSRDFKIKYKRSALGMAWSFLNPLLTMSVQYVVFSTLFKSDTPYYAVYLLTGIVFFNFFSEAVSMGMTSITGNAALIKKVYIPKYIFPVSKLFSSLINLGLSLIPLLIVMLVTGIAFTPALFLLVFNILCLMGFAMGMVLLMSTSMTFFQDTQFLWSIFSMIWMYLTPLFYPDSIISVNLLPIYRANPMYQYITFARTCIIDGISPDPMAYLWCVGWAAVVLALGVYTFKKQQSKFVLYL